MGLNIAEIMQKCCIGLITSRIPILEREFRIIMTAV